VRGRWFDGDFDMVMKKIPSLKLTWHLKIDLWKRRFLLKTTIFRGYVSFREGKMF